MTKKLMTKKLIVKKLILASTSLHRAKILRDNNIEFLVSPSNLEEKISPGLTPYEAAMELGRQKSMAVYASGNYKDDVVLGADTIVVSSTGEML
ncbi:MAG: Maf-like protein, partial [Candidatus Portiera sp.]|nr:Maf-like protein [Portiera sp.]